MPNSLSQEFRFGAVLAILCAAMTILPAAAAADLGPVEVLDAETQEPCSEVTPSPAEIATEEVEVNGGCTVEFVPSRWAFDINEEPSILQNCVVQGVFHINSEGKGWVANPALDYENPECLLTALKYSKFVGGGNDVMPWSVQLWHNDEGETKLRLGPGVDAGGANFALGTIDADLLLNEDNTILAYNADMAPMETLLIPGFIQSLSIDTWQGPVYSYQEPDELHIVNQL